MAPIKYEYASKSLLKTLSGIVANVMPFVQRINYPIVKVQMNPCSGVTKENLALLRSWLKRHWSCQ